MRKGTQNMSGKKRKLKARNKRISNHNKVKIRNNVMPEEQSVKSTSAFSVYINYDKAYKLYNPRHYKEKNNNMLNEHKQFNTIYISKDSEVKRQKRFSKN